MSDIRVRVVLSGCDDATYMDIEVTQPQLELLLYLEQKSEEQSSYGCMPVMLVDLRGDSDEV